MALTLTLDVRDGIVAVSDGRRRVWIEQTSQWLEFYSRLAVSRLTSDGDGWITDAVLAELTSWKGKAHKASIGKEVARHIKKTEARYGACVVECHVRTRRWRLGLSSNRIRLLPSRTNVVSWLKGRGMGSMPTTIDWEWLAYTVRSQIAYHRGEAVGAMELARLALQLPGLDARSLRIAGVALIRASAMGGDLERVDDAILGVSRLIHGSRQTGRLTEAELWGTDDASTYFAARIATVRALASPWPEAADDMRRLQLRISHAQSGGNLSALAIIHNLIGVLARRRETYTQARYHLEQAVVLSLSISDLFTLGAALFNLSQAMLQDPVSSPRELAKAEQLLELSTEIDTRLGVGRNTSQAEILKARWEIGKSNAEAAERLLAAAAEMVAASQSKYDEGCLCLARAEFTWMKFKLGQSRSTEALRATETCLVRASRLLAESGKPEYEYVEQQLTSLRAGEGLMLMGSMLERYRARAIRKSRHA
jgi:hypothetical protein